MNKPFFKISGVGKIYRSFNGEDQETRDSNSFLIMVKIAINVCAWYVPKHHCFRPCDLKQNLEDRQSNLYR